MKRKPIPILMYHSIDTPPKKNSLRSLYVSKKLFYLQMLILKLLGYQGMSMNNLLPYLEGRKIGKVFGITFDDGYKNNLLNALPILKKFNFTATCYFLSDNFSGNNYWDIDKGFIENKTMSISDAKKWINEGMEAGSHSVTHSKLSQKNNPDIRFQVQKSKEDLERKLDTKIEHFCYPYGAFNDSVIKNVEKSGYKTGVTVERALFSFGDLYQIPRLFITHRTYPHLLLLKFFTNYERKRKK